MTIEELEGRIRLADGDATVAGLELPGSGAVETLVLENPEAVEAMHRAFLDAGAALIRTLSLQASRAALAQLGLGDRCGEILWQAAQIARSAARSHSAWVAGAVGPLFAECPHGQTRKQFCEQVGTLLDGGCDLICLEGFQSVEQLLVALHAKQEVHHCPVICFLEPGIPYGEIPRLVNEGAEILALRKFDRDLLAMICRAGALAAIFASKLELPPGGMPDGICLLGGGPGVGPREIAKWHRELMSQEN